MRKQILNRLSFGIASFALMVACIPASAGPLQTNGRFFQDASGRVVILRGYNVAGNSKIPPFAPITNVSQLDPLAAWGVNVIRLLFNWEAYQPAVGQFVPQYLSYINSIVDAAWTRGIYVVIDVHEGGYSRFLASGCGNGFPLWAVSPLATTSTPDNSAACKNWLPKATSDPGVLLSFNNFYANSF